jgi:hypothetical protein
MSFTFLMDAGKIMYFLFDNPKDYCNSLRSTPLCSVSLCGMSIIFFSIPYSSKAFYTYFFRESFKDINP